MRRCLEDVNTQRQIQFLSESELGCGPQDSVGQFTHICHYKRVEIKAKKVKNKKRAFILIARDDFVALAVIVAKAPYILESDSSILVLLQARVIKCGKVSEFVGQIVYTYQLSGFLTNPKKCVALLYDGSKQATKYFTTC